MVTLFDVARRGGRLFYTKAPIAARRGITWDEGALPTVPYSPRRRRARASRSAEHGLPCETVLTQKHVSYETLDHTPRILPPASMRRTT